MKTTWEAVTKLYGQQFCEFLQNELEKTRDELKQTSVSEKIVFCPRGEDRKKVIRKKKEESEKTKTAPKQKKFCCKQEKI